MHNQTVDSCFYCISKKVYQHFWRQGFHISFYVITYIEIIFALFVSIITLQHLPSAFVNTISTITFNSLVALLCQSVI